MLIEKQYSPIIIIGGGFAGLLTGIGLQEYFQTKIISITSSNSRISDWELLVDPNPYLNDDNNIFQKYFLTNYKKAQEFICNSFNINFVQNNNLLTPKSKNPGKIITDILMQKYLSKKGEIIRGYVEQLVYDKNSNKLLGVIVNYNQKKIIFYADLFVIASGGLSNLSFYTSGYKVQIPNMLPLLNETNLKLSNATKNYFIPYVLFQNNIKKKVVTKEFITTNTVNKNRWLKLFESSNLENFNSKYYSKSLSEPFSINESGNNYEVLPIYHYLIGGINISINGQTSLENVFAAGECADIAISKKRIKGTALMQIYVFTNLLIDYIKENFKGFRRKTDYKKTDYKIDKTFYFGQSITKDLNKVFWKIILALNINEDISHFLDYLDDSSEKKFFTKIIKKR